MIDKITLESCKFEFSQEANCCSNADDETIEVEYLCDLGLDRGKGGFFVLKTEQWAVQDEKDLKKLFDRIKKIMKK